MVKKLWRKIRMKTTEIVESIRECMSSPRTRLNLGLAMGGLSLGLCVGAILELRGYPYA